MYVYRVFSENKIYLLIFFSKKKSPSYNLISEFHYTVE